MENYFEIFCRLLLRTSEKNFAATFAGLLQPVIFVKECVLFINRGIEVAIKNVDSI